MRENSCIVIIKRNGKDIVIFIRNGDWNPVPNLDFIEDIEIIENHTNPKYPSEEK
jgi:hypothetical protein